MRNASQRPVRAAELFDEVLYEDTVWRATGESMQSYIARRKRWERRLTDLDADTKVSSSILTDYLLEFSGISKPEKLMIRTVCGNRRKFDEV